MTLKEDGNYYWFDGKYKYTGEVYEHPEKWRGHKYWSKYTSAQTDTALWTPTSGKAAVITDLFVFARGNTDGEVTVFVDTDVNGNRIFKNNISVAVIGPFTWNHTYKLGIVSPVSHTNE